jgi:hypothetical protein
MSCSIGSTSAMALLGVAMGGLQSLALIGGARRHLLWLPLTALGVWLAFLFGYTAGFAVSLLIVAPIAVVAPEHGGPQTIFVVAVPVGGLLGGVLVGALQSPLVQDRRDWLRRSAIGGIFMLPASLAALYAPSSSINRACEAWQPAVSLVALLGGLVYGVMTARQVLHVNRSNGPGSVRSGAIRVTLIFAAVSAHYIAKALQLLPGPAIT